MNKIFKAVTLALILAGTASAENDSIVKGLQELIDKQKQEKNIITGKTIDETLKMQQERLSFNRDEWEKERKRDFEATKLRRAKVKKTSEILLNISSKALSDCRVYENFRTEKGREDILENSDQREEIRDYLEFLKLECKKSEAIWDEYLKQGGK